MELLSVDNNKTASDLEWPFWPPLNNNIADPNQDSHRSAVSTGATIKCSMDDIENTLRLLDGIQYEAEYYQSSQFFREQQGEALERSDMNTTKELMLQLQKNIEEHTETLHNISISQPTTKVDSTNTENESTANQDQRHKLSTNSTELGDGELNSSFTGTYCSIGSKITAQDDCVALLPAAMNCERPSVDIINVGRSQCFQKKRHGMPIPISHLPLKKRYIYCLDSNDGADFLTKTDDGAKNRCFEENDGKFESESVNKSILNDKPIIIANIDTKSSSKDELKCDASLAKPAAPIMSTTSSIVKATTTTETHSVCNGQNETITKTSLSFIYGKKDLTPFPVLVRDPRLASGRSTANNPKFITPNELQNKQTKTAQATSSMDTICSIQAGWQQHIRKIKQDTFANSFQTLHRFDCDDSDVASPDPELSPTSVVNRFKANKKNSVELQPTKISKVRNSVELQPTTISKVRNSVELQPTTISKVRNSVELQPTTISKVRNSVELQPTTISKVRNSVELQRQLDPDRYRNWRSGSQRSSSVGSNDSNRHDHRDERINDRFNDRFNDRRHDRRDYERSSRGNNGSNTRIENRGNNCRNYRWSNHRDDRRNEHWNYRRADHFINHRENHRNDHREDHRDDRRALNSSSAAYGHRSTSRNGNGNRNSSGNLFGEHCRRDINEPNPFKLQEIDYDSDNVNRPRFDDTEKTYNPNDPRLHRHVPRRTTRSAESSRTLKNSRLTITKISDQET